MLIKCVALLLATLITTNLHATTGKRPYEMDWANRTHDAYEPLIPFTDTSGWQVECENAAATFETSREQLLFGPSVAKLTYRATTANPRITLRPPTPITITTPFDAIGCWIYGNNHSYAPDPKTPPVTVTALLLTHDDKTIRVHLDRLSYKEWFWLHRRLTPAQLEPLANGARLSGIEIIGGTNLEDRTIYLNSLSTFKEELPNLEFTPRAQRGFSVFPNAPQGLNTGPGKLPFPNTPLTIIPHDPHPSVIRVARDSSDRYLLIRDGEDGRLEVRLPTSGGNWDDLAMRWVDTSSEWFSIAIGGGIYFADASDALRRPTSEKVKITSDGKSVTYSGVVSAGDQETWLDLKVQLIGKSLVFDLQAPGGNIAECRTGSTTGLPNPRRIPLPYYTYNGYGAPSERPHLIVAGTPDAPLFFMTHIDWTQSNATLPFVNPISHNTTSSNGGTRYLPATNGKRNPCYERFVYILSPEFTDTLPNIPNPTSPWKHLTGTRVWRPHGAGNRQNDINYWRKVHSYGLKNIVVNDHEVGWRDGNESFTFRTNPAPGKGGDQGQYDYARVMQDELGFLYGPYNNFTDFAPVNGFWDINLVTRTPDNQLQRAWERCYAPKPSRAVKFCERLAPIIQQKFNFNTAYCDVHTAVTPWSRVDYDSRVPGAASFAPVFYAFGEIMLLQKQAWQGPVYSEGNNHFPYCGLTDGNYAQDQAYRPAENPWLVDFDLRCLHDLCCNFGMGSMDMFYPRKSQPSDANQAMDRFLAATVAFGHPGFLLYGRAGELRSYYMIQALAARYTQASATDISYSDANGTLHPTSAALANGCYTRSQVVTRYSDNTITAANGSTTERMQLKLDNIELDLPPNGYWGRAEDGAVTTFSGDINGHRVDLAYSPEYLYADARGLFTRFDKVATDGVAIMLYHTNNLAEIITWQTREAGFPLTFTSANAFDSQGQLLGPARIRTARGLSYIQPTANAHKYRVQYTNTPPPAPLTSTLHQVAPGEQLTVAGTTQHTINIPSNAQPGNRLWYNFEESWIDFTVVPPFAPKATITGRQLNLTVHSAYLKPQHATIICHTRLIGTTLQPGNNTLTINLEDAELAQDHINLTIKLQLPDRALETNCQLTRHIVKSDLKLGDFTETGTCLRNSSEQPMDDKCGASVNKRSISSNGIIKQNAIFMHPPYIGGTGYTYATFTINLPSTPLFINGFVGKEDGSHPGDGILYKLLVQTEDQQHHELLTHHVPDHNWHPIKASLAPWAGQTITLRLITDVGTNNNSSGDWGAWADLEFESVTPEYTWTFTTL